MFSRTFLCCTDHRIGFASSLYRLFAFVSSSSPSSSFIFIYCLHRTLWVRSWCKNTRLIIAHVCEHYHYVSTAYVRGVSCVQWKFVSIYSKLFSHHEHWSITDNIITHVRPILTMFGMHNTIGISFGCELLYLPCQRSKAKQSGKKVCTWATHCECPSPWSK